MLIRPPKNLLAAVVTLLSLANLASASPQRGKTEPGELGGDDIQVAPANAGDYTKLAVASSGDLYLAVQHEPGLNPSDHFKVYRSTDTGDSWAVVGSVDPPGNDFVRLRGIDIFEGNQDRVFVSFESYEQGAPAPNTVRVAWADLTSGTPAWNFRTVMGQSGMGFFELDLGSDAISFDNYFLYAVARGQDGNGDDIWFSRSLDYGNSWSTPYRIASVSTSPNLMYAEPKVAYGQGGFIHVAFTYTERAQDLFDDGVRALRASNFASSASNWDSGNWILYSSSDGTNQRTNDIIANPTGPSVSVFVRGNTQGNAARVFRSADSGASWKPADEHALPTAYLVAVAPDYNAGRILAFGNGQIADASFENTSQWQDLGGCVETAGFATQSRAVAVDPSRSDGIALSWLGWDSTGAWTVFFDAEWRGGPGYPNYEPGFPLAIEPPSSGDTMLRTAPAIANIDDDEFDEILFANTDGYVHAYNHDGSQVPGWPIVAPAIPWRAPLAVGDLNGDGNNVVVVGTTHGQVHCYDGAGNTMPGFPVDLGTGANTYVSIGAVGPPYPRWIVVTSGNRLARINYRGEVEFKSGTMNGIHMSPAAIGDIDADGDAEIVYHFASGLGGSYLQVINGSLQGGTQAVSLLPEEPNGAITLGDLDLDGDLEICHPTANGMLHVLHHDMSDVAGFPISGGFNQPITSVGMDQILGTAEPELFFTSLDGRVHLVRHDGSAASGFPTVMSWLWFAYGAPISTAVAPDGYDVITSSTDTGIYAFRNVSGSNPPGWPRAMDDAFEVTAAAGDIDRDGSTEIVFVGNLRLHVVDVAQAPSVLNPPSWTMYAADPARSGCMDCIEDVTTDLPEGAPTTLAFRQLSANPSSGPVSFAATLPEPGILSLEIFDLRGRRVRLVTRREVAAGSHELFFDRSDQRGAHVASGIYVARMSVRTTGRLEALTRKFVLVD